MSHVTSQFGLSYDIAHVEPSELNFILHSWKKSYREACPDIRTDDYYRLQGAVCDEILSRFPTILVARTSDGVALGWVLAESTELGLVVHYLYVKSRGRRLGVAKALLSAVLNEVDEGGDALLYTHKTRTAPIAERYGFKFVPVGRFLREIEK